MSQPRVIATADLHLDVPGGGWDPEANMQRNWVEALRQFGTIIDHANAVRATHLVVAGDVFHTGRPTAEIVARLNAELSRLDTAAVLLLDGNHDQQTVTGSHRTPLGAYLSEHPRVVHVASEPAVVEHGGVHFALLPWLRVGGVSERARMNVTLSDHIRRLADEAAGADFSLLFGHAVVDECTFDSGRRSSEVQMTTAVLEASVPTAEFDAGPWQRARLGHIHRRQELSKTTGYIGSSYKVSFGERAETKAFDDISVSSRGKARLDSVVLSVRELIQADISAAGGESPIAAAEAAKRGDIVRFVLDADGEPHGLQLALATLAEKGITPQLRRLPRDLATGGRRQAGLAVDTDPVTAFALYADTKVREAEIDAARVERLRAHFDGIVRAHAAA